MVTGWGCYDHVGDNSFNTSTFTSFIWNHWKYEWPFSYLYWIFDDSYNGIDIYCIKTVFQNQEIDTGVFYYGERGTGTEADNRKQTY